MSANRASWGDDPHTPAGPVSLEWTELDKRAVDTIRVLAMDAVENTGNGHPGTAMSLAPAAYLLYQRLLRFDPADPDWHGRDRFVLSCGHSSLTLYIQLFYAGLLDLDDLQHFRQWGSRTPGHPEHGLTPGVETTTGPLGQGLANAVGMAMAARRERGLLDPDAAPGSSPFDHRIFTFASDGDIEEGITHEASALAGHQQLGNLIAVYDDNQISIEDDTNIALSEDVARRYEAYGWHVQVVEWRRPNGYHEDVEALWNAYQQAVAETGRPSLIVLKTIIAWPAPHAQNTGKAHGSALGADEVAATKAILGFDTGENFPVEADVLEHVRQVRERGAKLHEAWEASYQAWRDDNADRSLLLDRMRSRRLPDGWDERIPSFEPGKSVATRVASGAVLSALAPVLPELWGGSADLAGSNNTTPAGEPSFIPPEYSTKEFTGDWYGRVLHFGIREHAMGAILNGIALHGGTRPYGATFLTFSDYMRPAVRLAALMELPVIYVWTHDSIGLGEDGPTHQPVEHLAALRAIPNLQVIRPADANETTWAWREALAHPDAPKALVLTRQGVPTFDRGDATGFAPASEVGKGGYVLVDTPGDQLPDVVLIATGSEVQLAVDAREALLADGVAARVVSMPCVEWFDAQDRAYRDTVIPPAVKARVSVEAGVAQPWYRFVGDAGRIVSLEHFGASADYKTLFSEFGLTTDAVAQAARESIAAARG